MRKRIAVLAGVATWFLAGVLLGYALALPEGNLFLGVLACMAFITGGSIFIVWF